MSINQLAGSGPIVESDALLVQRGGGEVISSMRVIRDFMLRGAPRGEDSINYAMIAGVIRNTGSGWALIDDPNHTNINVAAVSNNTTTITIDFDTTIGATNVVSFIAGPDETLAAKGFSVGASVTVNQAVLQMSQNTAVQDYVSYNGSAWTSQNSIFSNFDYTSGVLTFDHENVNGQGMLALPRGGGISVVGSTASGALAATQSKIEFWDTSVAPHTKITSASTALRAWVSRISAGRANPNDVNTTNYPQSNIWFLGLLKTN